MCVCSVCFVQLSMGIIDALIDSFVPHHATFCGTSPAAVARQSQQTKRMQQQRVAMLIRKVSVAKLALSLACALSSHSPSLSVLRSTCASLSLSTLTSHICLADVTYTRVCRMLHKFLWMESWKHRANNKNNKENKSNQSRKLKQRQNAKTMRVLYCLSISAHICMTH